jgi:predicted nucleotidyltransferase
MSPNNEVRTIDWQETLPIWQETQEVIAAWAFGSAVQGQLRSGSDLDIGVWFEAYPTLKQQLALLARLQDLLQVDEVDLVVLNDANPILHFEAVSGQRLFCRDQSRCAGFVSLTAREYEAAMALWAHGMRLRELISPGGETD